MCIDAPYETSSLFWYCPVRRSSVVHASLSDPAANRTDADRHAKHGTGSGGAAREHLTSRGNHRHHAAPGRASHHPRLHANHVLAAPADRNQRDSDVRRFERRLCIRAAALARAVPRPKNRASNQCGGTLISGDLFRHDDLVAGGACLHDPEFQPPASLPTQTTIWRCTTQRARPRDGSTASKDRRSLPERPSPSPAIHIRSLLPKSSPRTTSRCSCSRRTAYSRHAALRAGVPADAKSTSGDTVAHAKRRRQYRHQHSDTVARALHALVYRPRGRQDFPDVVHGKRVQRTLRVNSRGSDYCFGSSSDRTAVHIFCGDRPRRWHNDAFSSGQERRHGFGHDRGVPLTTQKRLSPSQQSILKGQSMTEQSSHPS